jgi:hypothetical protein
MILMFQRRFFTRILRGSIAIALTIWVAGLGCVFGCENAAKIATDAVQVHPMTGTLSAAASNHSCCKRRKNSSRSIVTTSLQALVILDSGESSVRECPLANKGSALASTSSHPQPPVLATDQVMAALDAAPLSTSPIPSLYQNRGHTYLRCCVFLI